MGYFAYTDNIDAKEFVTPTLKIPEKIRKGKLKKLYTMLDEIGYYLTNGNLGGWCGSLTKYFDMLEESGFFGNAGDKITARAIHYLFIKDLMDNVPENDGIVEKSNVCVQVLSKPLTKFRSNSVYKTLY